MLRPIVGVTDTIQAIAKEKPKNKVDAKPSVSLAKCIVVAYLKHGRGRPGDETDVCSIVQGCLEWTVGNTGVDGKL